MESTMLGARFFKSTRGQIVRMLRGTARTVEDLALSLNLTDNAVRAHLATLGRDGLVIQQGARRGTRKPHLTYTLTPSAEELFPKSYHAFLNVLLDVLKGKFTPDEMKQVLRQTGRAIAKANAAIRQPDAPPFIRVNDAVLLLEALGGAPWVDTQGDKVTIRSASCPLAATVQKHPEVCDAAETLVAQVTGMRVRERCNKKQTSPRCSFEILG
jgi:predicted ArsR family transcriptional regulator